MKLVIEIDLDGNNLEKADFEKIVEESKRDSTTGISIEVGGPVSEEETHVARMCSLSAEYFTVRIKK